MEKSCLADETPRKAQRMNRKIGRVLGRWTSTVGVRAHDLC